MLEQNESESLYTVIENWSQYVTAPCTRSYQDSDVPEMG